MRIEQLINLKGDMLKQELKEALVERLSVYTAVAIEQALTDLKAVEAWREMEKEQNSVYKRPRKR